MIIKNIQIVDGSGTRPYIGDIVIRKGKIAAIGAGAAGQVETAMDGTGLTAFPGFIDLHRHGDVTPFIEHREPEEVAQGITTFFCGVCGFSPVPNADERFTELKEYSEPILGPLPDTLRGKDFATYLEMVDGRPLSANMGFLVGNGAVRITVSGFSGEPLTPGQLELVKTRLRDSLSAGAFGMSVGLMYVPEMFYSRRELTEIFRVAAECNRPVFAHLRGEGAMLPESLREVLDAAGEAGAAVHISHLKAAGRKNWNRLIPQALAMIAEARARGRDVSFDAYPYAAGSTALHTLLPPEYLAGGVRALLRRLADPAVRRHIENELRREQTAWDNLVASTGWDGVILAGGDDPALVGKTVREVAGSRSVSPEECAMLLLMENNGNVPMVFHCMSEEDMIKVLTAPGAIVISDSLYAAGGLPHPRKYGAAARFVSRYALEKKLLPLEAAVKSATMLPARRMGLRDRGTLEKGMFADMQLIDLAAYRDTATFIRPHSYPEGLKKVMVGGRIVWEDGKAAQEMPGRVLRP